MEIKQYAFNLESASKLSDKWYGNNWPVVYIISDKKKAYIGETINVNNRMKQHLDNESRKKLNRIDIIIDERFNKSAALDIESQLIEYMSADQQYEILNSNNGMRNHEYYEKEMYHGVFNNIWSELKRKEIVKNDLEVLRNSDLFKYSPYKRLTEEQYNVVYELVFDMAYAIITDEPLSMLVNGEAGTGKTVLAMYLMKLFSDKKVLEFLSEEEGHMLEKFESIQEKLNNFKLALVVPMASLRSTLKRVFSSVSGLKSSMVIGPFDVFKDNYDLLIVDESHRLNRRKNIVNYAAYDSINRNYQFDKEATQLDWILKASKYQIFFYDQDQSIRPSDVRKEDFNILIDDYVNKRYFITSQLRVEGGRDYLKYIKDIFSEAPPKEKLKFGSYEFSMYNNLKSMRKKIYENEKEFKLSRLVAGYAWEWKTKNIPYDKIIKENLYDIKIEDQRLVWNNSLVGWATTENAINEVGSIHTIQGYDLNYAGVIIGPELTYNKKTNKLEIIKEKYFDSNGKRSILNDKELREYIINIYNVLLTRAIKGTYVYVCDKDLRDYLSNYIELKY